MYSKKKHRMDSEPLAKTNKLSSQGPTDKQDSNNNNNFHIEVTPLISFYILLDYSKSRRTPILYYQFLQRHKRAYHQRTRPRL